jgi:hypothetical protein
MNIGISPGAPRMPWQRTIVAFAVVLLVTATGPADAQTSPRDQPAAAPTSRSLSTDGLSNRDAVAGLFTGDFTAVDFNRDDLKFEVIFQQYLTAYARTCSASLPPNKVEMTRQECATEQVTRNGFGVEISRTCVSYVTVGTGLYADPDLYAAKLQIERLIAADAFRHVGRMLTQADPLAGAMSLANTAQAAARDMNALVQMNACTSPALRRFEDNLRRFALNQPPIRLDSSTAPVSTIAPAPGTPFRDHNYRRLTEDLVADQARTWALNRFVTGSVTGVSVSSRDALGRPAQIVARYGYQGFNGSSQGTVTVHFSDGLPDCLYFFDAPAACRTPNRKVVAAYASGAYQE